MRDGSVYDTPLIGIRVPVHLAHGTRLDIQMTSSDRLGNWEVLAVNDARFTATSLLRWSFKHVVGVLVLRFLECGWLFLIDAFRYRTWNHVSQNHPGNSNPLTNLGKCTCPSRGCSRRSQGAGGSSLPRPPWVCARSTRSVGKWNPRRSHRCRTPTGTPCHSRPSLGESEGGQMGSTTGRPPSSRR